LEKIQNFDNKFDIDYLLIWGSSQE
jgi:hypothetical protein